MTPDVKTMTFFELAELIDKLTVVEIGRSFARQLHVAGIDDDELGKLVVDARNELREKTLPVFEPVRN